MDALMSTQQCKHCEKIFFNRSLWQEHYDLHTGIQMQLGRSARYGPVDECESKADTIDQISTLVSRLHVQRDDIDTKGRPAFLKDKGKESNLLPNQAQMEQYLQKAIADFPPYEGGGIDNVISEPTIHCPDCDFCFYTQEQRDEHHLSRYCRGNQIEVYIMTIDSSAIGGYRVYKESVPFESTSAHFKCSKCSSVFTTDAERKQHELIHPMEQTKCAHCEKILPSQYELGQHYLWHDDIHLRQHIDRRVEQMKQQRGESQSWNNTGTDTSDPVTDPPLHVRNPWNRKGGFPQYDGDVVAISFLSKEDLEMRYAPDGLLKDLSRESIHLRLPSAASNKNDESATQNKRSYRKSFKAMFSGRSKDATRSPSHQSERPSLGSSSIGSARGFSNNDVQEHMEWQLFYRHMRSDWVLTHDRSQHVEIHAGDDLGAHKTSQSRILTLPSRLSPEELQSRFEGLLGEIADYAGHNHVENIAGLQSVISETTAAGVPSRTHIERLQAWLGNEEKRIAATNSEINALCGLPVLGHGSPSRILVRDRVGRARLMTGQDLSRVTCHAIGPPRGSLDVVRMALGRRGEAALARGRIQDAERAYTEMFRAMQIHYGDEQLKFILFAHLAGNVYKKHGNMANAAGMYMQGLRCSQRLYGLKSVNNFTMMTNIAIYYEDIGRLDDATALYRRSVRGRINAGEKENALMNIQELSTVYRKMGKDQDALQFVEQAYTGYTQVVGPDHRMTLLTLNNLAAYLFTAGSTERAQSLLGPALPAITRVLGLDDPVSWGSVCNFVMYYRGSSFPPAVTQVIDQYMAQNTPASLKVLNGIGDHYGKNNLIRKAMETYCALHEKRMSLLGPSHPETWSSLYAYAYTLDRLGETSEALKRYRVLALQPQPRSLLPESQVQACQAAVQDLSRKQAALDKEKAEWGLTTARKCSLQACSNSTLRFCSDCRLVRFCSAACQKQDKSHHGACIPSVTLTESTFTIVENPQDKSSVVKDGDFLFTQLQLPRRPRCESARDVFIDPNNFTTIRISKRPSHILSFQANPGLDLRFAIHRSSPFTWLTPKESNMLCMLNDVEDSFIVVAPGESMMKGLVAARDKVFGTDSGNVDIPDQNLVEFAQTGAESDRQFVLGFMVTEWAL